MNSTQIDLPLTLAEQCRHQVRLTRKRWGRIPWLFVAGLCFSILGLLPSLALLETEEVSWGVVIFLALGVVLFGWAVGNWLAWPMRLKPRIVPYFTGELGEYGGNTMTAFARGRGLYREIVALDRLAGTLGVKPLSAFGFAYDYFEQEVRWHAASEGLSTVLALLQGLDGHLLSAREVALDLEALASVMRIAGDKGINFSLVLRLQAGDNMQAVCTREDRQGSFW